MQNIVYIVQDEDNELHVHHPQGVRVVHVDYNDLEARLNNIGRLIHHRKFAQAGRETVALAQDLHEYRLYAEQLGLKQQESDLVNMIHNLEDLWRDENVG